MADLRERLIRRSERFELPPDAMARMFERGARLQRRRRVASAAIALAIGLAGTLFAVTALRDRDPIPGPQVPPSPTVGHGAIPEGTYRTAPMTRQEIMASVLRAGFSRRQAEQLYFDHLSIPLDPWIRQGLVIEDGFWFQTATSAGGQEEAGWGGSFEQAGSHRVVATDNVCTITYRFSISGEILSLELLHETGPPSECALDVVPQTAIYETAPFVATSPTAGSD
jgi:hypothetical protein